jgi:hypothetical protein
MITVGTTVVSGSPINGGGGGGLPPGGTATDVLIGPGTWSTADSVVGAALGSMLSSEPAGTAIVADGAGDVTATSADVSALLASADAPAMRSALCDRTISLAGLTPSTGNGTAVAATGTLSYANGQTGAAWADYPRLVGAHGASIWAFEAAVRIAITGAGSANTVASLGIGSTGSAYDAVSMVRLFGDGQIDGLAVSGGAVWSVYTPGTLPVDGTGWLRVRVQAGTMTCWTGVGASYSAAAWTLRDRRLMVAPPNADNTYPSLALVLYQGVNPGAPGVQAVFSDLVIRDLP